VKAEDRYDDLFRWYAGQLGVDWTLLKAQALQESGMNPGAINTASGAAGLTQFEPGTFQDYTAKAGRLQPPMLVSSRMNAEHAIRAQACFMRDLLSKFGGDASKALAAYDWGPSHLMGLLNGDASQDETWLKRTPPETQDYVSRILAGQAAIQGGTA
jgi:soluble lytic murein transglycosylase-like protein